MLFSITTVTSSGACVLAGGYLVKVAADGHVVYKWYHRLFLETARIFFLSDKPFTDSLHRDLANYFNGRYAKQ